MQNAPRTPKRPFLPYLFPRKGKDRAAGGDGSCKFPTTSQSRLRRASIPTPFVPSGHFPLIGGIGPWEGSQGDAHRRRFSQPLSQLRRASIPTPFVPSGHFPRTGGIGPWEGSPFGVLTLRRAGVGGPGGFRRPGRSGRRRGRGGRRRWWAGPRCGRPAYRSRGCRRS